MSVRALPPALAVLALLAIPAVPAAADSALLTVGPDAYLARCRADIAEARSAVARLRTTSSVRDPLAALDAYDSAWALLRDAADRSSLAWNVHPDAGLRTAASSCESEAEAALTDLSLDRGVYDVLVGLDVSNADEATRYYVQRVLRDFRRAGVDRDEAARTRIRALRDELITLGQDFGRNVAADVRSIEVDPAELDGLPDDFVRSHPPGPNGRVTLTTSNTDYVPVLTYAKSARLREKLWRLYRQRGHPENLRVLNRMLTARKELAGLLGFDTWADYITSDKMIGTSANVSAFITRIAAAAEDRLRADYAEVVAQRQREVPGAQGVDAWDSTYYQEQVRAARYDFDSQAVRPYFEYSRVKRGVMDITARMFGITYRRVADAAVWHDDVEVYDVLEGSTVLGRIYLDMYPRENKYTHYAQFTLVNGKAGRRLPEGVLVCNFPRPGAEPALMLHSDVEAFFHEWGHLLHQILGGHTRWAGISGVATEWDFVEAPSQMFEEWVWDVDVLQTFAKHHRTGEPIPADLVARMKRADEFGQGLWVRQQMFYAATSLELHRRDPEGLDSTRLVAELQEAFTPFPFADGTYFEASFTHLDGYSAIYYTYMWSMVIAKDLFTVFEREGLLNPETAGRYRRTILEPGGSKPAAALVEDFLGRPYSFDAYEAWIRTPSR